MMRFLPFLGANLKDEAVVRLLLEHEVEVAYHFDRLGENTPDQYWAPFREQGFQFLFDEAQTLMTVFLYLAEADGFLPVDLANSDIPVFGTLADVKMHAVEVGTRTSKGSTSFLGIARDWFRRKADGRTVHHEFQDGSLVLITLARS